jgi:SprT protein
MMTHINSYKPTLLKYTTEPIVDYIVKTFDDNQYQLVISPQRSSKLGDYSPPFKNRNFHRISVNGNLNQYAFFITFLHELAHLLCWLKYKNKVKSHGQEWKDTYASLITDAISKNLFPVDLSESLVSHMQKISSSTTFDYQLIKKLSTYDIVPEDNKEVEVGDLEKGAIFEFKGRIFKYDSIMRKRALCFLMPNMRKYSFSPLAKVKLSQYEK